MKVWSYFLFLAITISLTSHGQTREELTPIREVYVDSSGREQLDDRIIEAVPVTAALDLNGWDWNEGPQLGNIQIATETIIFQIKVTNSGELIGIKKTYGDLKPSSEATCMNAIRNLTFTKKGGQVPEISTGSITFTAVKAEEKLQVAGDGEKIFMVVDEPAEYKGGRSSLFTFVSKDGTEGMVFVSFVVDKDGQLSDLQILKGLTTDCDQEAIRVIRMMPPWIPGKKDGQYVKSRFVLPIKFKKNL